MTKAMDRNLLVGLDIGSTKITALIGEVLNSGEMSIIGVGSHPARGMDKGGVVDLDLVVDTVQRALAEAELMADCKISSVYLGVSGKHIQCFNERGMEPITDKEVTQEDIDNAIHTAKSVKMPDEHRILHVLPQEFAIDYQEGIKNPLGLSGVRMEAKVHLIACHNDMVKNIVKCVERCQLQVDQLIFSALASSYAVLTDDEKELGVCVVDIGSGTMDLAVFTGGSLRHTSVIPLAGNSVTRDIATVFGTPLSDAESVKVRYGCALGSLVARDDTIEVPSVGGRPSRSLQRQTLAEVIEPRYSELFGMIKSTLDELGEDLSNQGSKLQLGAGVVLTGGASQIEGVVECAERILQCQVRVGQPMNVSGLTEYVQAPTYATAVGLLHYGKENKSVKQLEERSNSGVSQLMRRLSTWLKGEF
ncbi:cell division protein FtsA [Alginatibacterium sediminis]|uniref:Cell division protein FtsA n=1 Tax=Alginatibacterium sediminis TaxID=2164068 RepID=A0A420E8W3_9ALTE|nr:cell division protein FtsA [Alginatibacterium sediminis]RKF15880.1 cell division protein FtsA [Alginatibacterium sediminis]